MALENKIDIEHLDEDTSWKLINGTPFQLLNALDPATNTRIDTLQPSARDDGYWCYYSDDGHWRYFNLLRHSGIYSLHEVDGFTETPAVKASVRFLQRSPALVEFIQDELRLLELYNSLSSNYWKLGSFTFAGSWREAANITAAMGGKRAPATQYLLSGSEGLINETIEGFLEKIGGRFMKPSSADWVIQGNARLESLIATCSTRAHSSLSPWYRCWAKGAMNKDPYNQQLHMLALNGQIKQKEFEAALQIAFHL
ncbi:hypothetical protein [Flexibacterium corallicola]|uniref:hypothetical protein n=1 Tax=Flexibacterium corallicola TaxID=3037259 RepID=UPI00286EC069|nr:hypothetical protein [Pseudovibrio sp. M1P-2-3]